jgi:hypothetical protein
MANSFTGIDRWQVRIGELRVRQADRPAVILKTKGKITCPCQLSSAFTSPGSSNCRYAMVLPRDSSAANLIADQVRAYVFNDKLSRMGY